MIARLLPASGFEEHMITEVPTGQARNVIAQRSKILVERVSSYTGGCEPPGSRVANIAQAIFDIIALAITRSRAAVPLCRATYNIRRKAHYQRNDVSSHV